MILYLVGIKKVTYYERGVKIVINIKDLPDSDAGLTLEELAEKYSQEVQDIKAKYDNDGLLI